MSSRKKPAVFMWVGSTGRRWTFRVTLLGIEIRGESHAIIKRNAQGSDLFPKDWLRYPEERYAVSWAELVRYFRETTADRHGHAVDERGT